MEQPPQQQQGLSRAAKKRKRAKQKTASNNNNIPKHTTTTQSQPTIQLEKKNHDQSHDDEEDEELLPMKKPAKVKPTAIPVADLPSHIQNIQQLLNHSINPNNIDDDEDDEKQDITTTRQLAHCILQFLLAPANLSVAAFYEQYWEQKPLYVKSSSNSQKKEEEEEAKHHRWDGLWSISQIQSLIREKSKSKTTTPLYYSQDITVSKYTNGKRITFEPTNHNNNKKKNQEQLEPIPVEYQQVWDEYYQQEQCSIRFLCPHQFSKPIHRLLSILEHEFGCMVGANAYLTPPSSSQGFAPHYDDIEAFVIQLEGKKRWRVYAPKDDHTTLPRISSHDFSTADLEPPVLDIILEPGDVLYMPRGWIHQANTNSTQPSLHLTVSAYQQWTWTDLLEILLPDALEAASMQTVALRKGLPPRFLDYMGIMHDNRQVPDALKIAMENLNTQKNGGNDDGEVENEVDDDDYDGGAERERKRLQEEFRKFAKSKIWCVAKEAIELVDAACDQMGKRFLSDRLPPAFLDSERRNESNVSGHQGGESLKLLPTHLVRLARPGIARLVLENDVAVVYHCVDNSVVFHEKPLSPLEFELDDAPAIEQLLTTTEPRWIPVADLYHDSIEDKVGVTQALYDEGILTVREAS